MSAFCYQRKSENGLDSFLSIDQKTNEPTSFSSLTASAFGGGGQYISAI